MYKKMHMSTLDNQRSIGYLFFMRHSEREKEIDISTETVKKCFKTHTYQWHGRGSQNKVFAHNIKEGRGNGNLA
jgi:hypothetical protein